MVNLFSIRTPHPSDLEKKTDIVGKKNDYWILKTAKSSDKIVACWGNHGTFKDRYKIVIKNLDKLFCLKINKSKQPAHPLYLKSSLNLIKYNP